MLGKKGIQATTRAELTKALKPLNQQINYAKAMGAQDVVESLTSVKKEITDMVNSTESVSDALMKEAFDIHPDVATFLQKFESRRGPQVGPDDFKKIAGIMSEKLAERVPEAQNYIVFWKDVGRTFVRETEQTDIPWVTFDNKVLTQKYRAVIQKRIQFWDPVAKRYVRNIYQKQADDAKLLGKGMVGTAGLGLGVNGTHSNDASIVRMFHLWGRDKGYQTATIHDAIFMNVNELDLGVGNMYDNYARARATPVIRRTLDEMRKKGLSRASYKKFLAEAERLGLLDTELTPEMIRQNHNPPPGLGSYSWGP